MVVFYLADYQIANMDWEIYGLCHWSSPLDDIGHLIDDINSIKHIYSDEVYEDSISMARNMLIKQLFA